MSKNPWAQNFVQVLFEALGDKQVKCVSCESTKAKEEIYMDLGIPIEQHSSVSHSLRQFTDTEHLCGTNKLICDNCGGHQEAEVGIKIRRLPPILALHLQRFENIDWTHTQKLFYRVQCPDTLRVPTAATDDNPNPDQLYELVAIVVHIGITPTQGHYVTLKRIPSGLWVMCDDDNIEPVPASDLFHWLGDRAQGQNYVLFYQAVGVSAQDLGLKVEKRKPYGVFKPVGEGVKVLDRKGDDEWRFGSLGSAAGALVQERDEESVAGSVPSPGPAFASIPPSAPSPKADVSHLTPPRLIRPLPEGL
ncbi:ubiquitin carboxyl-terminal hydrolase 9/13 [Cryptococcus neoformans A1-35-8]|nr:ubiquitin carboxyl-terminal hydrolase 9/13 [Cryptococcus neoformans var. grubii A1-35-8]